jgi:hypothetical protein
MESGVLKCEELGPEGVQSIYQRIHEPKWKVLSNEKIKVETRGSFNHKMLHVLRFITYLDNNYNKI